MRFQHNGAELNPPVVKHAEYGHAIKMPPALWRLNPQTGEPVPTFAPCKPGSIAFMWEGKFYTVPPGGHLDLPDPVDVKSVTDACPHLTAMAHRYTLDPGYAFGDVFEWGLGLVLDGLEVARAREEAAADAGR